MRDERHVARIEKKRNMYRILMRKPEGKMPLRRPRPMWGDDIKMDLKKQNDSVNWIYLAQDRYQRRKSVNTAIWSRVSKQKKSSLISKY